MEWMIGAWKDSGCRYQRALVQRIRGRVNIRRLEKSWGALLTFHPILRSTFCPIPSVRGNSDHLLTFCVLDVSPANINQLKSRKLPPLYSEEQKLAAEAKISVTHPAVSPDIHARLTVLEGKRDAYLLFNSHHFQYSKFELLSAAGGELSVSSQMLGVFLCSSGTSKRSTLNLISIVRQTLALISGRRFQLLPRGKFRRGIGMRSSPQAGSQASLVTHRPPERSSEGIMFSKVLYPH